MLSGLCGSASGKSLSLVRAVLCIVVSVAQLVVRAVSGNSCSVLSGLCGSASGKSCLW